MGRPHAKSMGKNFLMPSLDERHYILLSIQTPLDIMLSLWEPMLSLWEEPLFGLSLSKTIRPMLSLWKRLILQFKFQQSDNNHFLNESIVAKFNFENTTIAATIR